jgi:hypothetical protein
MYKAAKRALDDVGAAERPGWWKTVINLNLRM